MYYLASSLRKIKENLHVSVIWNRVGIKLLLCVKIKLKYLPLYILASCSMSLLMRQGRSLSVLVSSATWQKACLKPTAQDTHRFMLQCMDNWALRCRYVFCISKGMQSINKAGKFLWWQWWQYLSNRWPFGTRSRGAEQRFDEPLLLREGSPHAVAAGKCARSWTATQQWKR